MKAGDVSLDMLAVVCLQFGVCGVPTTPDNRSTDSLLKSLAEALWLLVGDNLDAEEQLLQSVRGAKFLAWGSIKKTVGVRMRDELSLGLEYSAYKMQRITKDKALKVIFFSHFLPLGEFNSKLGLIFG